VSMLLAACAEDGGLCPAALSRGRLRGGASPARPRLLIVLGYRNIIMAPQPFAPDNVKRRILQFVSHKGFVLLGSSR